MHQQQNFFDGFPGFDYDPTAPISEEFKRLGKTQKWKPEAKIWKTNWRLCMDAEYHRLIGGRATSLKHWQLMCDKLGIAGEFTSIRKCKTALSRVYVNIIDLLECWETDRSPRLFLNAGQLAAYCKDHHKFFRRNIAKQDKILRVLLKRLL
ncbi:uncharacterized protein N7482_008957 [Penicillium canariense]|uniref:Uncharacterized protein n=1 Tax=Penicillium canariense TaxID=189055 RepID=A0A9W9LJ87_9EURO|nr:uncharacterized protein N7482_008957 [Penicillium canariense]KAJ5157857.1 hypothetical protein N7482_008957 [Penicillium canariense]